MPPADRDPLILTLALDAPSFAFFEALRSRHFPPERNFIPAHVTLFHALPGAELDNVETVLDQSCRDESRMHLDVVALRFLGRGVAYTLRSEPLSRLHAALAARWQAWLTAQDRHKLQPHVTVQNKVAPEAARALLAELQAEFRPFTIVGEGLRLWRYRGGPWDPVRTFRFDGGT
jgi:hypothetical protein